MNRTFGPLLFMRLKWLLSALLLGAALAVAATPPALLASLFLSAAYGLHVLAAFGLMLALTFTGCLLTLRAGLEMVDARVRDSGKHQGIPPTANPILRLTVMFLSLFGSYFGGLVLSARPSTGITVLLASVGVELGAPALPLIIAGALTGVAHAISFALLLLIQPSIAAAYETYLRHNAMIHQHQASLEAAMAEHQTRLQAARAGHKARLQAASLEAQAVIQESRARKEAVQREIVEGTLILTPPERPWHA